MGFCAIACSYFLPKCSHFLPECSHFLPQYSHFLPECSHFLPKYSHLLPECSHFLSAPISYLSAPTSCLNSPLLYPNCQLFLVEFCWMFGHNHNKVCMSGLLGKQNFIPNSPGLLGCRSRKDNSYLSPWPWPRDASSIVGTTRSLQVPFQQAGLSGMPWPCAQEIKMQTGQIQATLSS